MNKKKDIKRDTVSIKPGEKVALCRCWHSKTFPRCDGSHNALKTSEGPIIVTGTNSD
ncbi:MAG: CDGSH iron-sulfur domain-containing protein [Pseudomonadota bacterium]|nr:CDGSH iron-sulfur domain-containing protein [Pseudomonadota bacterium]